MNPRLQPVDGRAAAPYGRLQSTRIVCLGNELASDDGIGIRIGRSLRLLPLPENVVVRFSPQIDLDLIDDLLSAQHLIFCDATRLGVPPGTVTVHDWRAAASWTSQPYCCHGIGLSDLVALAAELETDVNRWAIHLVGVEARVTDTFGTQLSESVQVALPKAVREVLELLAASDELIDIAEQTARDFVAPTALDVALSCS